MMLKKSYLYILIIMMISCNAAIACHSMGASCIHNGYCCSDVCTGDGKHMAGFCSCIRTNRGPCKVDANCCGNDVCSNGKCHVCQKVNGQCLSHCQKIGGPCKIDNHCCGGAQCIQNKCT